MESMKSRARKSVAAASVAFALVACASSSGVHQDSANSYRVATRSTWEIGGRAGAVKMALKEATAFCAKQGATVKVLTSVEDYGHFEGGTVDMRFSCEPQASSSSPSPLHGNAPT